MAKTKDCSKSDNRTGYQTVTQSMRVAHEPLIQVQFGTAQKSFLAYQPQKPQSSTWLGPEQQSRSGDERARCTLPPGSGRRTGAALECAVECSFRFVANAGCNFRDTRIAIAHHLLGQLYAPSRQIPHGRFTDQLGKAFCQH